MIIPLWWSSGLSVGSTHTVVEPPPHRGTSPLHGQTIGFVTQTLARSGHSIKTSRGINADNIFWHELNMKNLI